MEPEEIEICRKAFNLAQRNLEKSQKQTRIFKNLKKTISLEILKQIESPKKLIHCIFVVSSDFDLIAGIASYIYHVHASASFMHLSYAGHTDQEIIYDLFPPNNFRLDFYLRGRAVFISGLGNGHQLVFERLLGAFREINFVNPYRKDFGFLIIGIDSLDSLPPDLLNLSDVISTQKTVLFEETTLTVTIDGKKYSNFQDYEYKLCKLLYENRGEYVDYERIKEKAFCSETTMQQIHNTKSSIEKKLNGCVNIESKRGVGYMMTV